MGPGLTSRRFDFGMLFLEKYLASLPTRQVFEAGEIEADNEVTVILSSSFLSSH